MKYKLALFLLTFGLLSSSVTVFAEEPTESVQEEQVVEKKEVLLDYKPDDLAIDFPSNINLSLQPDNTYRYEGVVSIKGDNAYRVDLNLKNTAIEYINADGSVITGVASLGDNELDYDEVLSGASNSSKITIYKYLIYLGNHNKLNILI